MTRRNRYNYICKRRLTVYLTSTGITESQIDLPSFLFCKAFIQTHQSDLFFSETTFAITSNWDRTWLQYVGTCKHYLLSRLQISCESTLRNSFAFYSIRRNSIRFYIQAKNCCYINANGGLRWDPGFLDKNLYNLFLLPTPRPIERLPYGHRPTCASRTLSHLLLIRDCCRHDQCWLPIT